MILFWLMTVFSYTVIFYLAARLQPQRAENFIIPHIHLFVKQKIAQKSKKFSPEICAS